MRLQYGSSHASGAHAIALRSSSTTLCKGSSSAESGWMGALWFLMKPLRTYNGGSDHAASFPGTKRFSGNPSLFAGIPMIFPVILGNQLKMRLFQQKKENVAHVRKVQLGNSRETRGACKRITAAAVTAVFALSHLHSPRVEKRVMTSTHLPTCALQQALFLGTKVPFSTDSPRITRNIVVFPQKGWDSRNIF